MLPSVRGAVVVGLLVAVAVPARALMQPLVLDEGTPVVLLSRVYDTEAEALVALGELAFKSDLLLEGSPLNTMGAATSCDACHPDGGASAKVFFEGLSDRPGNIDVTNRAVSFFEDGLYNPLNLPSLVGSRHTAPFARDGRFESVRDFTLFAIVNEFGGGDPSELVLDALVAFQESLAFPANPRLDDQGRLTERAWASAHRGEAVFHRPFANDPAMSCATCHVPATHFVDRLRHDVGVGEGLRTGKAFDTPTLRDTRRTAPYFHNGRYDTLAEVVAYFDAHFELGLSARDQGDLTSYLTAIGGGVPPERPATDQVHPVSAARLLDLVLAAEDWNLTRMLVLQASVELAAWKGRSDAPADDVIDGWIAKLRAIQALVIQQNFAGAQAVLAEFRGAVAVE